MGFSHYWRLAKISQHSTRHAAALRDMAKIIKNSPVPLAGPDGTGKPYITKKEIAFNGKAPSDDHETFVWPPQEDFEFCKTARKPYDLIVTACLAVAKDVYGNEIEVSSDGNASDWVAGVMLASDVLGRRIANPIGTSDLEGEGRGSRAFRASRHESTHSYVVTFRGSSEVIHVSAHSAEEAERLAGEKVRVRGRPVKSVEDLGPVEGDEGEEFEGVESGTRFVLLDNGGKTADRYTIFDSKSDGPGLFGNHQFGAFNERPYHPQGFGQHGEVSHRAYEEHKRDRFRALGKKISFSKLGPDAQRFAREFMEVELGADDRREIIAGRR